MRMRHSCDRFYVNDIPCGIADRFTKDRRGLIVNQCRERLWRVVGREANFDPLFWQHVGKQCISSTIKLWRRHNIFADFRKRQNRVVNRGATRAYPKRTDTALQIRNSFLEHIRRWIHQTRVNISRHCEVKEIRTMLRIIKLIRDCLVNRSSDRVCGWVRFIP